MAAPFPWTVFDIHGLLYSYFETAIRSLHLKEQGRAVTCLHVIQTTRRGSCNYLTMASRQARSLVSSQAMQPSGRSTYRGDRLLRLQQLRASVPQRLIEPQSAPQGESSPQEQRGAAVPRPASPCCRGGDATESARLQQQRARRAPLPRPGQPPRAPPQAPPRIANSCHLRVAKKKKRKPTPMQQEAGAAGQEACI